MRRRYLLLVAAIPAAAALAGCHSSPPGTAKLTINDPYWDRVNVEIVITRRENCDSQGDGFISTRTIVMRKNVTQSFDVPDGASLCWRHDRDPNKPAPGVWSDWTKATPNPGASAETDL